jgi:hypothetical protein
MDYNKFERNLILLLKIFNDRPNHLSKFLIDNNSFTPEFIELVLNSDKLNGIKDVENEEVDFSDFSEMNEYFKKLIDQTKGKENLSVEMNNRLFELIKSEDYESAAKLRDYMKKKNINIII